MSTEPLASGGRGTAADSEQGLLFVIALMVLLGVGGIFLVS